MKTKKIVFTIITFAWVAVIFGFSLQPGKVSGDLSGSLTAKIMGVLVPGISDNSSRLQFWNLVFRKFAHFSEYFILGTWSAVTLRQMQVRYRNAAGICFCILVAAIDETIQLFVEGRVGSPLDVLLDSTGAVAGIVAVALCIKFIAGKRNKQMKCEKNIKK